MNPAIWKRPLLLMMLAALAAAALLPQPWKGRLATHGHVHSILHAAAFGAAFLVAAWGERNRTAVLTSAVLLLLFGSALEWMQVRVYGNLLERRDIAADAIGILAALALRTIFLRSIRAASWYEPACEACSTRLPRR